MAVFNDGERPLDFSKTFRGRVVQRTDPKGEGRVGVFIPNLVTEHPNSAQVPSPKANVIPASLFANQGDLRVSNVVNTDIFIWARPSTGLVEGGVGGSTTSGEYRVPKQGTMVEVYFEDRDPSKPFYRMSSPTVAGDVVDAAHIGKGTNAQNAAANWKDPAAKPNIDIIRQWDSGTVMYFDGNPNANCFVLRFASGHTLLIGDATESGILMQTAKGHLIQLDENSGEIRVRTQTGNCSMTLKDNGDVTGKNTGKFFWDSTGDMTLQSEGKLALSGAAGATLSSSGPVVITGSSNRATPWFVDDPHGA
jgi:hypothetical protein